MSFLVKERPKTVSFHTLGCKLNFAETSTISRLFADNGYLKVNFGQPSDVVVINTCTVTAQADKKCRQAISKAIKISPGAILIVVGCYAELKAEEIGNLPGVSLVLGNQDKFSIVDRINNLRNTTGQATGGCNENTKQKFFASYSLFDRTRSFLKVQDGCDYRCTYCTIPKARGHSRNAPVVDVVTQAEAIASQGIREIVLTGVNIGDFGRSTGESFLQLLQALDVVEGIERIRIGSVEPNLITEEVVALMAKSKRLAAHFHVPLQSGNNKILGLMARRYQRELFAAKIDMIHSYIPHAAVGADVIVGFPGETDDDFTDAYNFIESLRLAYLHVFTYSERPDTKAINMAGKVPAQIADARSRRLISLSDVKRRQFYEQNIGRNLNVLFEQKEKNGLMTGFTDNYIKAETEFNPKLIGCCTAWTLKEVAESGTVRV